MKQSGMVTKKFHGINFGKIIDLYLAMKLLNSMTCFFIWKGINEYDRNE